MSRYVLNRLLGSIVVLWIVLTIVFIIVRLLPGDPAQAMLGIGATEEEVEALRARLGLDGPLLEQYLVFLGEAITLDFGTSFRTGRPALAMVGDALPTTASLAGAAMLIAVVAAAVTTYASALRPWGFVDRWIRRLTLFGQAVPEFWLGLVLIMVFSGTLRMFPSGGAGTLAQLVLPAITLALPQVALLARVARSSVLEISSEPFLDSARSRGFRPVQLTTRHVLKNVAIPVLTVGGLQLGTLLAGAVIVEEVFARPGIGRLLVGAIETRDYPIVVASILTISATYIVLNFVIDVLYTVIDRRIIVGASA